MIDRKRNRHLFLWYVPGSEKAREFRFTPLVFRSLVIAGGVLLIALILGGVFYTSLVRRSLDYKRLQADNKRLRHEVARVDVVQAELIQLQKFAHQVKRSLTEGSDLERIMEANEAVQDDDGGRMPKLQESWVPGGYLDGTRFALPPSEHQGSESDLSNIRQPLFWPLEGFVTREFQLSPIDPIRSHSGIDIAVPRGTPVRSVASGMVIAADWTPRLGNRVIIDHGGGNISVYGHNEMLLVYPRERVYAGMPIALAGNSGISTAPHLHLEIWVDGQAVDPRAILPNQGDDENGEKSG
ncbi:M23 family metallopeptidase [bacterium]|nr:M23 family metallopeptidase [bacterium]